MRKLALHFLVTIFAIQTVPLSGQAPEKPAPGFTLEISVEHDGALPPDTRMVLVRLTNISKEERRETMCPEINARYNLLVLYNGVPIKEIEAVQKLRKQGAFEMCRGDLQLWRTKPGAHSDYILYATNFYDMSKPGSYEMTVSRETFPNNPEKSVTVTSNTLTIVVPKPRAVAPK